MHYKWIEGEQPRLEHEFSYQSQNTGMIGRYCEDGFPFYYINQKFVEMLGYDSAQELVTALEGKAVNLIHPEDLSKVRSIRDYEEGKIYDTIYRIMDKKGDALWVIDKGKIIRTEDGHKVLLSLCTDMLELIRQKNELEQKQLFTEEMLKKLPGGYHRRSVEDGFPFLYISEGFLEILGWTENEIYSKFDNKFLNLVHPDDKNQIFKYADKILLPENKNIYQHQVYRLEGRDGYRWISDTTMQMLFEGQEVYQCFIFDITEFITERERKEQELEELRSKQVNTLNNELKDSEEKLDAERQYLDVLCWDYTAVYQVNLSSNIAIPLKVEQDTFVAHIPNFHLREEYPFVSYMKMYADNFVAPIDREKFQCALMPENLRKELKNMPRYVFRYQSIPSPSGHVYFEAQAIRMTKNMEDDDILLGFRHIDDVVAAERLQQFELEQRLEREKIQNEDFIALGRNYDAIFRIDLTNDTYIKIACEDSIRYYYSDHPSARQMLIDVCDRVVDREHYQRMRHFFDLTTLAKRLRERDFVEIECITKKGVWHRTRLIAKRRDDRGEVIHVLYVTQIINDEKQYEEHLIAKAEYADFANQSKSSFISQVAHDIRTPMNSIFGFLEIAEAHLDDLDKIRYSLDKIRVSGEFLKELVNDVLDISRMEDGRLKLQPTDIQLSEMLEEISISMQNAKFGKTHHFSVDIHDIFHDWIVADVLRLKQIYTNVLSNAIKYTPNGGNIEFTVYQEEIPDSGRVRIVAQISDNGMGMSEAFMEKMFTKFERGTDTRINKVSGYGLGLAIVKQLVNLMGGSIDVQSELGKGTTFCIKIEVPYVDEVHEKNEVPKVDDASVCAGMNILVVEDNELNREVITELLAMHDITCECAEDGVICLESLRMADEGGFDVILMDMQMPNMDGLETTRQIRALSTTWIKNIPIIAMTANAMKADVEKCLDAGMNQHLSKPVDMQQLLKVLAQIRLKS